MKTDAETMMQEGCRLAGQTWVCAKKNLGWTNDDVTVFFAIR